MLDITGCFSIDSRNLLLASAQAVAAAARDLMDSSSAAVANSDPGTKQAQGAGAERLGLASTKVSSTCEAVAPGTELHVS